MLKEELIKSGNIEENEEVAWGLTVSSVVDHSIGILRQLVSYRYDIFYFSD